MAVGERRRNDQRPVARPVVVTHAVPGSPDEVFDLLDDLDNHDWIGGRWLDVVDVRRVSGAAAGADLVLRRPFVADRPATTTIEERDPPHTLVGTVEVPGVATARLAWDLRPLADGTSTGVRLTVVPLGLRRRDQVWLAAGGRSWLEHRIRAMLVRLGERVAD